MNTSLLICTQKVDAQDQVLGFFVRWIEQLAPQFQRVTIICLEQGEAALPRNCQVYSLGKERGKRSSLVYAIRFLRLILTGRVSYDAVFVHMNQEYVLLAGWWWRLFGKRILLWRNHPSGSFWTKLAAMLAHVVFYTSDQSYTARFSKAVRMPVGIQLPDQTPTHDERPTFLSLGRLSPVKHVDTIVDAFAGAQLLVGASLRIVGDPIPRAIDHAYVECIDSSVALATARGKVVVREPGVSPEVAQQLFGQYTFFINATDPGSFDKTILEAAAQGCIPLVAQDIWRETEYTDLSEKLVFSLNEPKELSLHMAEAAEMTPAARMALRKRLRGYVEINHGLAELIRKLVAVIRNERSF